MRIKNSHLILILLGIWILLYGIKLLSIIPDWDRMYGSYPDYLPFFKYSLYYFIVVIFMYVTYAFIAPIYTERKNWLLFIPTVLVAVVALATAATFVKLTAYNLSLDWGAMDPTLFQHYDVTIKIIAQELGASLIHILLGFGLKLGEEWYRFEQERKELDVQKVESELSFLKSQVNPHFLFNTLNNIFSLASVQSPKTAPAVQKLSEIMRYMTYETDNRQILLSKEIEYISAYLELQKLRFGEDEIARIHFDVEGNPSGIMIEPMLLIPFVENAFKHGDISKEANEINIRIGINKRVLEFDCSNQFIDSTKDKTGGVGIKNVSRRLELLYPKKHNCSIQKENNKFQVSLSINLNHNESQCN